MKKLLFFIAAGSMAFALTACGNTGVQDTEPQDTESHDTEKQILSVQESSETNMQESISLTEKEGETSLAEYDFSVFTNVELTGIELSDLNQEQLAVLYQQARYCQAMTEADIETMDEIVSDDMVFTHMSGRQQTKEEYFADVADGSLRYFNIGMESPVVKAEGNLGSVTYTSVLNADAYGARSIYRMNGTHWFENRDGVWYSINNPER